MLTVSGDNLFLRAEITCPAVLNNLSDGTDEVSWPTVGIAGHY